MIGRRGIGAGVLTFLVAVLLCACSSKTSQQPAALGDAAIKSVDVVAKAGQFQQPLDAAPSADGSTIYFTGKAGGAPAVFSVPAAGGAVVTLASGAPLVTPVGIAVSGDGGHVYVADTGAGQIFSVPSAGGTPAAVTGSNGWAAHGLDVVSVGAADFILFTGVNPASKTPGLFSVAAAGGTPTVVAQGAPFTSPDSVVVTAGAKGAYVSDRGSGSTGSVLFVNGLTASKVVTKVLDVALGNPGGLTLTKDGKELLVSSQDATSGADQVLFVDLASRKTGAAKNVIGANHNTSGGLHRARDTSDVAWADTQGTVYRIRLP